MWTKFITEHFDFDEVIYKPQWSILYLIKKKKIGIIFFLIGEKVHKLQKGQNIYSWKGNTKGLTNTGGHKK
jgi:hypothetical protein